MTKNQEPESGYAAFTQGLKVKADFVNSLTTIGENANSTKSRPDHTEKIEKSEMIETVFDATTNQVNVLFDYDRVTLDLDKPEHMERWREFQRRYTTIESVVGAPRPIKSSEPVEPEKPYDRFDSKNWGV
jgi:hypothetical protein